jgi:hypothetical protein
MLALLLLALAGYTITQSREPLKTLLYALGAMALTFGIVWVTALVIPKLNTEATGAAGFDVALLVGVLTAMIHSRKNRA